jgi:hypothetical protein
MAAASLWRAVQRSLTRMPLPWRERCRASTATALCTRQPANVATAAVRCERERCGSQSVTLPMHEYMQHSTAQHSTAQHSTAQHSTAQHSTAQHSNTAPPQEETPGPGSAAARSGHPDTGARLTRTVERCWQARTTTRHQAARRRPRRLDPGSFPRPAHPHRQSHRPVSHSHTHIHTKIQLLKFCSRNDSAADAGTDIVAETRVANVEALYHASSSPPRCVSGVPVGVE